jgi:GT2 family glycosyltransferase
MKLTVIVPIYLSDPLHQEFTQTTLDSIQTKHETNFIIINNFAKPQFQPFLKELNAQKNTTVLDNPKGNILAAAWNLGIRHSLPLTKGELEGVESDKPQTSNSNHPASSIQHPTSDYCLLINNDLIFHPQAIDNLVDFAQNHPECILWTASEWPNMRTLSQATWEEDNFSPHPHFSCFMVNQHTVDTVGLFDENFEMGYFEDNDYHIRILLSGNQAGATDSSKFYHFGSRTIHVDDKLNRLSRVHYQKNRKYLESKWGIDLHGKGFSPPEAILKETYPHPFNDPQKSLKDW